MDNIKIQKEPIDFKKTFAGFGAIVILLVVGGIAWFFMQDTALFGIGDSSSNINQSHKSTLTGTVFVSLISNKGFPVPALLDVATSKVFSLPVDKIKGIDAISLQYSSDYDSSYSVFLGETKKTYSKKNKDAFNIYLADIRSVTSSEGLINSLENAKVVSVSDTEDYFKEFPVVSSTGEVLYSSLSKKEYDSSKGSLPKIQASKNSSYSRIVSKMD